MRTTSTRKATLSCSLSLLLGALACWAAKMPISDEDREKQATHIVTGKVIGTKSAIEKGAGNKDEIFSIEVMVATVRKGENVKKGDEIVVVAWKPHTRMGLAQIGLQGHDPIPKKGQVAEFFLTQDEEGFKPLLPNGIEIKPQAKDDAADARTSTTALDPWEETLDDLGEEALRSTAGNTPIHDAQDNRVEQDEARQPPLTAL